MGHQNFSKKNTLFVLITALLSLVESPKALAANTANYYKCNDRVSGEYNYGRAPQACNANAFGDDKQVASTYGELIFDDADTRSTERTRYVNEMNAFIKEAANYYMKKRKPSVSSTELSWWVIAVQATSSHESYWSHYRVASDSRLKMMRGDYGHGHGMMQIDDRAHFDAITSGMGWNLISNLTYAMDILYKNWERAPSYSCVKKATNYEARIRASWAAYNGGSAKFCRWTNSKDTWAQNDKNFYAHLNGRLWQKQVTDGSRKSSVDVACLMEKKENCASPSTGEETSTLKAGKLYVSSKGLYCVLSEGKVVCVDQYRDAVCLNALTSFGSTKAVSVKDDVLAKYAVSMADRHVVCGRYEETLYPVGTSFRLLKNTNLRATVGGGILAVVAEDQALTVLDFEIRNHPDNDRYYKVQYNGKQGYVYGGNKTDYLSWATESFSGANSGSLARAGESVKIVNSVGINQRATVGGALIRTIPKNAQLLVLDVVITSSNNKIYYKVSYQGQTGYIYTGFLLPTDTIKEWTQVVH